VESAQAMSTLTKRYVEYSLFVMFTGCEILYYFFYADSAICHSCALVGLLEARGSLSGRCCLPVPSLPKTFQATKARKPFEKLEIDDIDADDSDKENQGQSLTPIRKVCRSVIEEVNVQA
jgi:hypothetical protein